MLAYKPKSDLLPVMPGMRVYSVDPEEYVTETSHTGNDREP